MRLGSVLQFLRLLQKSWNHDDDVGCSNASM